MIIATDLEGVLIPEIWERIAEETQIPELKITTHDIPDFTELMRKRVEILSEYKLKLSELKAIANNIEPYLGTGEFLKWARKQAQVMIISDTFYEFSDGIMEKIGPYNIFANRFLVNREDMIEGCDFRIRGKKEMITKSLKEIGFYVIGIGDGFNDRSLFSACSSPILYRTAEELTREFPNAPRVTTLDELKDEVEKIISQHKEDSGPNTTHWPTK